MDRKKLSMYAHLSVGMKEGVGIRSSPAALATLPTPWRREEDGAIVAGARDAYVRGEVLRPW